MATFQKVPAKHGEPRYGSAYLVITEALTEEVGAFRLQGKFLTRAFPNLDESRLLFR